MNKLTILMPSWKTPNLLELSIPSLINSITDAKIIVILNEADQKSIDILDNYKITHIDRNDNIGPSAVDFALDLVNTEYIALVNSDMFFAPNWDKICIETIEKYYPATCSCAYIENKGTWFKDNLGQFNKNTKDKFLNNVKNGKYNYKMRYGNPHPLVIRTEDYKKIGGISNNFDQKFIESRGRAADDYIIWQLHQLNNSYKFIINPKALVFHGVSLTELKFKDRIHMGDLFQNKTGLTQKKFYKMIKYGEYLE